jgi:sugar O-acyltransferase (sialic acid O-acetyltransferase NeuD family)
MKQDLILVGGGGHCRSCIDVIESEGKYAIAGIVDRSSMIGQQVLGYKVIATDDDLSKLIRFYQNFFITIGQIKSPSLRENLFEGLSRMGAVFPSIISPLAYVSDHAHIRAGTIVMHRAVVNTNACIGYNCIINTGAIIEHDVDIQAHCHISTGAIVNGGVTIGQGTFLGSHSTCRENLSIGSYCVVGMGVKLFKDCADNSTIAASGFKTSGRV